MLEIIVPVQEVVTNSGCCAQTCNNDGCGSQDVSTGSCYSD